MAQAFAQMHVNANIVAYSAGSNPSGIVNPKAIKSMAELGYDLTSHDSKSLQELQDIPMDTVVSLGCGDKCPWVESDKHVEWDIPDPRHMESEDFNHIRDLIGSKVNSLLSDM
jgi:protein-tyrosine-phosphatase